MQVERRFDVIHAAVAEAHQHALFVHPNYLGVEHLVAAVEQLQRLAGAHAQHAADVVGGVFAQGDLRPIGQRLRMVNAGYAHG